METPVGFEPDRFPDVDASHRVIVERVVAEMRERVDETLSLRAMAKITHFSTYHFARTFRWGSFSAPCACRGQRSCS